ncbi:LysR family transcriptional regulator [Sediminispirochaeta smaragdinae]|uniref:Transcriptional regulator, LysR family n=1 Tax=Sediminispirochaeta smaragdinae (strain DSM 11293 / JCM 15392 / SEBR 4228) TaxID=573413 RepID=E1R2B5_SEDSS|nr:LysR family transcriptional regulator [Sediminispirochaeta smaragdinae]ADK82475.1 transcriptional regulator, LysR family [Sediminispirochaeta smaragdinae DSM 11293]
MTIQQLRLFLAVKKYMNFSVAADESYISQSSLSKHIKSLECELYVTLFDRTTRKISLTQAGLELSIHAEKIVKEYDKLIASLRDYSDRKKDRIRITSIPVMNQYRITEVIESFREKYPAFQVDIQEKDTYYVLKTLENRETDLAIIRTGVDSAKIDQQYRTFPIVNDELVLVASMKHPLTKEKNIRLSDAADENFILLSADTLLHDFCIKQCMDAGFVPHTQHSDVRLDTIKSLVKSGSGVSLLMRRVAEYFSDKEIGITTLADHPTLTLSIVAPDETLSHGCSKFVSFALESLSANSKNQLSL